MHAFDKQTDGQSDRETNGQTEFSSVNRICIPWSAVKRLHILASETSRRLRQMKSHKWKEYVINMLH